MDRPESNEGEQVNTARPFLTAQALLDPPPFPVSEDHEEPTEAVFGSGLSDCAAGVSKGYRSGSARGE